MVKYSNSELVKSCRPERLLTVVLAVVGSRRAKGKIN